MSHVTAVLEKDVAVDEHQIKLSVAFRDLAPGRWTVRVIPLAIDVPIVLQPSPREARINREGGPGRAPESPTAELQVGEMHVVGANKVPEKVVIRIVDRHIRRYNTAITADVEFVASGIEPDNVQVAMQRKDMGFIGSVAGSTSW